MIKELTESVASLPSVKRLTGGIMCDYINGEKTGLCIRQRPGIGVLDTFLDGTQHLIRYYSLELHCDYLGSTSESIDNSMLSEKITDEITNMKFPEIPEGKITGIIPSEKIRTVDGMATGSGILYIDLKISYITKVRRGDSGKYPV